MVMQEIIEMLNSKTSRVKIILLYEEKYEQEYHKMDGITRRKNILATTTKKHSVPKLHLWRRMRPGEAPEEIARLPTAAADLGRSHGERVVESGGCRARARRGIAGRGHGHLSCHGCCGGGALPVVVVRQRSGDVHACQHTLGHARQSGMPGGRRRVHGGWAWRDEGVLGHLQGGYHHGLGAMVPAQGSGRQRRGKRREA